MWARLELNYVPKSESFMGESIVDPIPAFTCHNKTMVTKTH